MRKDLLEIGLLVLLVLMGRQPALALSPAAASAGFYNCLSDNAKEVVAREAKKVKGGFLHLDFHGRVLKEIWAKCTARLPPNIPVYKDDHDLADVFVQDEMNQWNEKRQQKEAEATRRKKELDAPRLKAESDIAMKQYLNCLQRHSITLALNSSEPAETVIKAAIASCQGERQEFIDVHKRYNEYTVSVDNILNITDQEMFKFLALEIITHKSVI